MTRHILLSCLLLPLLIACGTTERPAGTLDGAPFRVVLLSDLNSSYGSTEYEPEVHEVVRLITTEWRPDLVLVAGDLIAGQRAALSDEQVRAMWEAFDLAIYNPIRGAGIPFAFTPGNHDASGFPAHERDRDFAREHWQSRDLGVSIVDSLDFPLNYAFRAGPLFVLSWDASTDSGPHEADVVAWSERQFARPEARSAGERWVLGHLPPFGVAVGRNRVGEVLSDPDSILARLDRWNVNMYVSGHQHAYYPARYGDLDLLHLGALGQGARQIVGSEREAVQTVTVVEIDQSGRTETTYEVRGNLLTEFDRDVLPVSIESVNGTIVRQVLTVQY
jgi:hypothetical protein